MASPVIERIRTPALEVGDVAHDFSFPELNLLGGAARPTGRTFHLAEHAAAAYGAWPDRLYLVGRDGRIAFQGGTGPFGFLPEELEAAIEEELDRHAREPRVTVS